MVRQSEEIADPRSGIQALQVWSQIYGVQPYPKQRDEGEFGTAAPYTWSEDKTRQYTKPARADFGAFMRAKGFCLE